MLVEFKEAVMRIRPLVWFILGVSLLLLALAGCSRQPTPATDDVSEQPASQVADLPAIEPDSPSTASSTVSSTAEFVAVVNGVSISVDDFEQTKQ